MKTLVRGMGALALGCSLPFHAWAAAPIGSPIPAGPTFDAPQFIQAVNVLEQQPLDKGTVDARPLLLSWLQNTPKVTVTLNLCQAKMPWAMGAKNEDPASSLLFSQDLLANASAQIQSPQSDALTWETQALEGTLRMYERIRTHEGMSNLQAEAIRKVYRTEGAKGLKAYTCAGTEPAGKGQLSALKEGMLEAALAIP